MSRILLLGLTLMGAGCAGRMIVSVEDAPGGGGTTIVQTIDSKNYVVFGYVKTVWWECGESGGGLACEKRCDVRDDTGDRLLCQKTQTVF